MSPTEGESTSTVDFSLITTQAITSNTTNSTAMISAKYLKPALSLPPPSSSTHFTVIMVIIAEPTPAQLLPRVERFSLSFPLSVNAGIIDQNGISIIVYVTPQRIYTTAAYVTSPFPSSAGGAANIT